MIFLPILTHDFSIETISNINIEFILQFKVATLLPIINFESGYDECINLIIMHHELELHPLMWRNIVSYIINYPENIRPLTPYTRLLSIFFSTSHLHSSSTNNSIINLKEFILKFINIFNMWDSLSNIPILSSFNTNIISNLPSYHRVVILYAQFSLAHININTSNVDNYIKLLNNILDTILNNLLYHDRNNFNQLLKSILISIMNNTIIQNQFSSILEYTLLEANIPASIHCLDRFLNTYCDYIYHYKVFCFLSFHQLIITTLYYINDDPKVFINRQGVTGSII